jgi:hypothetical protein
MVVAAAVPVARAGDTAGAASTSMSAPTSSAVAAQIRVGGLDEYGGLRPWMSMDEVRAVLGEPAATATQKDGREVWRYPAVAVIFDGQGRGVSALMVMGANALRIAGVGIGSSEAEILAALGEPVIPLHRTSVGGATLRYGSELSRLVFMLEKDRGVRLIGLSWFKSAAEAIPDPGVAGR